MIYPSTSEVRVNNGGTGRTKLLEIFFYIRLLLPTLRVTCRANDFPRGGTALLAVRLTQFLAIHRIQTQYGSASRATATIPR